MLSAISRSKTMTEKIFTLNFIKITLVATLLSFCTQFQATAFPLYVRSLGGSLVLAGAVTSIYMGVSMLCKPLVGQLLDRGNRKVILVISVFIFSAMLRICGNISVIPILIITRILVAPFFSTSSTAAATIATDTIPESRITEGLGYYSLSQTVSSALAPSLALMLIYDFSYKTLFIAAAIFAFAAGLISLTVRYKYKNSEIISENVTPVEEKSQQDKVEKEIPDANNLVYNNEKKLWKLEKIAERGAFLPSLMILLLHLGATGMITFLPTFAETFRIENIGLFFTLQAITLAISRLFIGKLSKILGHTLTITISLGLISTALIGICFSRTILPILICAIMVGLGNGAITPELHSIAIRRTSKARRGSTNSLFQMASEGGICISALYLGIVADLAGIQWIFFVGAFFPVFSLIVYYTLLKAKLIHEQV